MASVFRSDLARQEQVVDDEIGEADELVPEKQEAISLPDEDGEEEIEEDLLGEYILEDMKLALFEGRFVTPLVALLGLFIAYLVTIFPHSGGGYTFLSKHNEPINFELVRPVLSDESQLKIRKIALYAETNFWMPHPSYDVVSLVFHTSIAKGGVLQPPQLFYDGVTFGISAENSHNLVYTAQAKDKVGTLYAQLVNMKPNPTHVFLRSAHLNASNWNETGYAVHFSYEDLKKQGKLSSDPLQPWKRVLEDVLKVARDYNQVYLTMWYPHKFGNTNDASEPLKYQNIIQQIIPTRTGLQHLKSTAVVWMSKVNHTRPIKIPDIYRKPWSANDHWSRFLSNTTRRQLEEEKVRALVESGFMNTEESEIIILEHD